MAKSEREMLREWASIVEADKIEPKLDDPFHVGGHGEPMQIDIGLGGGGSGRGSGRGQKVEPILNKPSKPRIERQPGETPRQAADRARQELQAKPEAPAAKAPAAEPTTTKPEKIEPSLDQKTPFRVNPRAKDADVEAAKIRAAKPTAGEWWREKPIRRTVGPIAGAAAGAGLIGSLAKNIIGKKPDEDWADVAGNVAGDVADTATSMATSATRRAGERVGKAEREAGVTPEPEDFMARDRQNMPPPPNRDFRIPPEGRQGLDEMKILTKHPRTGKIVQLNLDSNILPAAKFNTVYESFNHSLGEHADWRCSVWSNTPISKIVKGLK